MGLYWSFKSVRYDTSALAVRKLFFFCLSEHPEGILPRADPVGSSVRETKTQVTIDQDNNAT